MHQFFAEALGLWNINNSLFWNFIWDKIVIFKIKPEEFQTDSEKSHMNNT